MKEKGFPQHITSHTYFVGDDKKRGCVVGEFIGHPSIETDIHLIDAPTQQMAMKWLRELYNIIITIHPNSFDADCVYYKADIWFNREYESSYDIEERERKIYEDSVEDAIKYCLINLII